MKNGQIWLTYKVKWFWTQSGGQIEAQRGINGETERMTVLNSLTTAKVKDVLKESDTRKPQENIHHLLFKHTYLSNWGLVERNENSFPKQATPKRLWVPQSIPDHYLLDKLPCESSVRRHLVRLEPPQFCSWALRISSPASDLDPAPRLVGGLLFCFFLHQGAQMGLSPHATWECGTHSTTGT